MVTEPLTFTPQGWWLPGQGHVELRLAAHVDRIHRQLRQGLSAPPTTPLNTSLARRVHLQALGTVHRRLKLMSPLL